MNRNVYLLCMLLLINLVSIAQTATFIGGGSDNKWRTAQNWDTGTIPGPSTDVILPAGSSSEIFGFVTTLQVNSITMQGDALLTVSGLWGINEASTVGSNATINWNAGTLHGPGTLLNEGTIAHATVSTKTVEETATIQNEGDYILPGSSGDFLIEGLFENTVDGTLLATGNPRLINSTTFNGIFLNFGRIETTTGLSLLITFENEEGIFDIQSGTCIINDPDSKLNGGEYTIAAGAEMQWIGGTTELSGTLSGTLMGPLNWFGNVIVPTTAIINFDGDETLHWKDNTLGGGGTLFLDSPLALDNGTDGIIETTTLENRSVIELNSMLQIIDGTLLNTTEGIINFNTSSSVSTSGSAATRELVNEGLILKNSSGITPINSVTFENGGTLDIAEGTVSVNSTLGFQNRPEGTVKGTGALTITANTPMSNEGTFAPGASPGTLTFNGDFDSETSAILQVELDGLNQGIDYDLLEITGNADFQGTVDVLLGFEPEIDDEFIVATTTGTITNCDLPSTVTGNFNNLEYTFTVECRNDNEVVLTAESFILGNAENEFSNSVEVYPNPTSDWLHVTSKKGDAIDSISVFSIEGKLLKNRTYSSSMETVNINMQALPSGIYFVTISSKEKQSTKRFIKQ